VATVSDRAGRKELYAWVYENNQWGRSPAGARYYSDSPSHVTAPYREYVARFVAERPDIKRVVDLACGDFQVARETDLGDVQYVGVDIYDELIEHNQVLYGDDRHEFLVCDLVEDELPPGDLCLLSMALYLMSHADVLTVLPKLTRYHYVLVTDGQADISVAERRNVDKPTGKYSPREIHGNGFYLELPPFDVPLEVVCEYPIPGGEVIRTVLIEHPDAPHPGRREEAREQE
jgi:hypothetical protein